ncbi:MAG TPA: hypothetical protein PKM73_14180 [Verrucomicrobiota bacterium]|nr:hypothetical protein [Verrucomicrobiota bacterium]HNU49708.1 hypothetical protein [Verrucomicrobiota bacterium]
MNPLTLIGVLWLGGVGAVLAVEPCAIEVVERGSGWPVPLVELRTTHQQRFVTDNAGRIAFDLPELMGRQVWFEVIGHGYEVAADGFGYRGVPLRPEPGGTLRVTVQRKCIARRLGRLTGAGLLAESAQLGLEDGGVETGVLGCDSVQVAAHRGRLFWLWGDTTLARHPLGIFHSTAATTGERALGSFEPPVRLRYEYFTDDRGLPRAVGRMPGDGPTWISACVSLPDGKGQARLVASYMKIRPPLEAYEWGLCVWNEEKREFDRHRVLWTKSAEAPSPPPHPEGHAVVWTDGAGRAWVLFGNPFPALRCPATFEAWQDPASWEVLESPGALKSAGEGRAVKPHRGAHSGSIAWHGWRRRWVTVFLEALGKPSAFGELWYAEAASPTGPWGPAVKVLSHDNYTFYNPRLHVELSPPDAPILLFEGTYTMAFADHAQPTPRYDYNQILYRLDLDDPALAPAGRRRESPQGAQERVGSGEGQ